MTVSGTQKSRGPAGARGLTIAPVWHLTIAPLLDPCPKTDHHDRYYEKGRQR